MGEVRNPLYVVTGINRMIGVRETCSRPYGLSEIDTVRRKMSGRLNCRSAYSKLKIERWSPHQEGNLW